MVLSKQKGDATMEYTFTQVGGSSLTITDDTGYLLPEHIYGTVISAIYSDKFLERFLLSFARWARSYCTRKNVSRLTMLFASLFQSIAIQIIETLTAIVHHLCKLFEIFRRKAVLYFPGTLLHDYSF